MKSYRMLNSKAGFYEITGSVKTWLNTAINANRYITIDDCEFAHELYGENPLKNAPNDKLIIIEPGKTYTISHYGNPVYLFTSDIGKYLIEHNTALIVSISHKSKSLWSQGGNLNPRS